MGRLWVMSRRRLRGPAKWCCELEKGCEGALRKGFSWFCCVGGVAFLVNRTARPSLFPAVLSATFPQRILLRGPSLCNFSTCDDTKHAPSTYSVSSCFCTLQLGLYRRVFRRTRCETRPCASRDRVNDIVHLFEHPRRAFDARQKVMFGPDSLVRLSAGQSWQRRVVGRFEQTKHVRHDLRFDSSLSSQTGHGHDARQHAPDQSTLSSSRVIIAAAAAVRVRVRVCATRCGT